MKLKDMNTQKSSVISLMKIVNLKPIDSEKRPNEMKYANAATINEPRAKPLINLCFSYMMSTANPNNNVVNAPE